jgi:hypothetical protein
MHDSPFSIVENMHGTVRATVRKTPTAAHAHDIADKRRRTEASRTWISTRHE